jgi:hypothetical protein
VTAIDSSPGSLPPQGLGSPTRARVPARHLRTDRWWIAPALTVAGLLFFLVYGLVRTASQAYYYVEEYHYLSPFTSPCVSASCVPGSSHLGVWFPEFPPLIPLAIVTLPFLLLFRFTCYYYRKAYYRSFWLSPPACAVPEPHRTYVGEARFPLILQNAHRYFFYAAFLISVLNTYDAVIAFQSPSGFGFGLGNVIITANVILLWAYTLSCHSCRHIVLGRVNHFSRHPVRYWFWTQVSRLNRRHMTWAWVTIFSLIITDAYIGLVAADIIDDLRFIG